MTPSPLDHPVWHSLATRHRAFSEGGDLAKRYQPAVNLFAAARDDAPEAGAALTALIEPGESAFLLQTGEIQLPEGLAATKRAPGVQMVLETLPEPVQSDEEIIALGEADAPDMLALATLTEPGPFLPLTHRMGRFLGVRIDGRLAAMAGERLTFPGFREVSGVCVHPDFRGRGLARALSIAVTRRIAAEGDQPFLHAWASNEAAITLYRALGFRLRSAVDVAVVARR